MKILHHFGQRQSTSHLLTNALKFVFGASLLASTLAVDAQLLKYSNRGEVYGAAAVSPDSTRQVLKAVVHLCSKYGGSTRYNAEAALSRWEHHHSAYLEENSIIQSELRAAAGNPGASQEQRRNILQMLDVAVPKAIEAQINATVARIKVLDGDDLKSRMCNDYIQSVFDGKWDLRINDPVVADFLEERIKRHGRQ